MKVKFKQIFSQLKEELNISNEAKKIILQSLPILFCIFLSIFCKWFVLGALIFTIIAVVINNNGKSLYFVFLLFPFVSIFKLNTDDFYLLPIVVIALISVLAIKLLTKLIKKQQKLNIPLSVVFAVFVTYLLLQLKFSNITTFCSLLLGLALLYIVWYHKDEISFKELVLIFAMGMFASILIGLFRPINGRLQELVARFTAFDMLRFSACAQNVNVFAGELVILLSAFCCLYMKKQIKLFFWIVYTITFFVLSFTISKSALLIFLFITFCLLIYSIIKEKKKFYKTLLAILCCWIFVVVVNPIRTYTFLFRLFSNDITSKSGITNLTTGRFDIWTVYFDYIFSSFKTLMFGYGISAKDVGAWSTLEDCSSHNTIIQMWYHIGIVGIILFLCLLCTYIGWKRVLKLDISIIVIMLSVIMFLMGLDFFSYRISNYFLLIYFSYSLNNAEKISSDAIVENKEGDDYDK